MTADEAKSKLVLDCKELSITDVHIIRRCAQNFDAALALTGNVESAYDSIRHDLLYEAGT